MKTRTYILRFVMIVCVAVFAAAQARADDPPQIDKGWNLISVTCDVSLDQFKQRLGNDEIEVFAWNGESYEEVDRLQRGYGYTLNSNAVLNSSSICGGKAEEWTTSVEIHQGWNLLGNPNHSSTVISELLGEHANSFADRIFEYKGNKYNEISKDDSIRTWRAIWVYSYSDLTLNYEISCQALTIELVTPETTELEVGDKADFRAICHLGEAIDCGEEMDCGTGWSESTDVTGQAQWIISDPEVLQAGEQAGAYTAAAEGACGVNAEYGELDSETITVTVTKPEPVLVEIELSADKTELEKGETAILTVTGHYSDGTTEDLTDVAGYRMSVGGIGSLDENTFTAMSPGTEEITAVRGDLEDSLEITVNEPGREMVAIELSRYPRAIEIYETAQLYAYARYSDGGYENIIDVVEWIYDESMGRIEDSGSFYPAKIGTVEISVTYKGITSNTVKIDILEKMLIWVGIFPEPNNNLKPLQCPEYYGYLFCYNNNYIQNGQTGKYKAIANYNNYTSDTVTDDIEQWETTDDSILTIAAGGYVTAHQTGTAGVRAYLEGVYSEWSWIQVVDSTTEEFLILEVSNRETILQAGETAELNATYYQRATGDMETYTVHGNEVSDGAFTAQRVTSVSDWTVTEPSVGSMDAGEAAFYGAEAGVTDVFAQYAGLTSNSVEIEVWAPSEMQFCSGDGELPEATWTDNKTIARLAVDCDTFAAGDEVNVTFDALLSDNESRRVLDVCLDLYIYNSDQELVKTMRHENCSPTPLFRPTAEGYSEVYDYSRAWDQTDDAGETVPAGEYMAVARFYVLYCPVLKVPFTILAD